MRIRSKVLGSASGRVNPSLRMKKNIRILSWCFSLFEWGMRSKMPECVFLTQYKNNILMNPSPIENNLLLVAIFLDGRKLAVWEAFYIPLCPQLLAKLRAKGVLHNKKPLARCFLFQSWNYALALTIRAVSRDFLRAAVFGLMTPRLAALSMAL